MELRLEQPETGPKETHRNSPSRTYKQEVGGSIPSPPIRKGLQSDILARRAGCSAGWLDRLWRLSWSTFRDELRLLSRPALIPVPDHMAIFGGYMYPVWSEKTALAEHDSDAARERVRLEALQKIGRRGHGSSCSTLRGGCISRHSSWRHSRAGLEDLDRPEGVTRFRLPPASPFSPNELADLDSADGQKDRHCSVC